MIVQRAVSLVAVHAAQLALLRSADWTCDCAAGWQVSHQEMARA
jgi:hypothetical protein